MIRSRSSISIFRRGHQRRPPHHGDDGTRSAGETAGVAPYAVDSGRDDGASRRSRREKLPAMTDARQQRDSGDAWTPPLSQDGGEGGHHASKNTHGESSIKGKQSVSSHPWPARHLVTARLPPALACPLASTAGQEAKEEWQRRSARRNGPQLIRRRRSSLPPLPPLTRPERSRREP
jgi:hypothetical protein